MERVRCTGHNSEGHRVGLFTNMLEDIGDKHIWSRHVEKWMAGGDLERIARLVVRRKRCVSCVGGV